MNKLFIVLLAVCIVSAHAFVKRDTADAKNENYLETIQKQFVEATNLLNEKISHSLNPEEIKKGFGEAVDSLNKALEDLKAKTTSAPK